MAVSYKYFIKVGKYYVKFVGSKQDVAYVSNHDQAEPFMSESLARAKARYKNIKDFEIEKLKTKN